MKRLPIVVFLAPVVCCAMWQAPSAFSWDQPEPTPPRSGSVVSGYMLGSPLAFTSSRRPEIDMKWPGFSSGGSPPMPGPPDFKAFVPTVFPPMQRSDPSPILAMSMGLESINMHDFYALSAGDTLDGDPAPQPPSQTYALLQAGPHGWVAIEFTVNEAQLPSPPGSDVAPDIVAAYGVDLDASVFSFVVPGSDAELLPNEFESVKSIAADDLGLREGDKLQAVDLHAALFYTDLSLYAGAIFSTRAPAPPACIYFTLRPEYASEAANSLQQKWHLPGPPDAATIFMSRWVDGEWETPHVYQTAANLGIAQSGSPPRDHNDHLIIIDGLSIDAETPGVIGSDGILFSLDALNDSEADQFRYAIAQQPQSPPPKPPRRVIVPNRTSGYGSLGKMTRAGAAHGDFCEQDPVLQGMRLVRHLRKGAGERLNAAGSTGTSAVATAGVSAPGTGVYIVDDFAISRRLRPDGPYTHARDASLGDAPTEKVPPGVTGDLTDAAEEALAVASYRWGVRAGVNNAKPVMRTCMSWPAGLGAAPAKSTAWVRHGMISDLAKFIDDRASVPVTWSVTSGIAYNGDPLVHDLVLPTNGLLLRPPKNTHAGKNKLRAYAAQWFLEVNGELYTSPLSVLRF